VREPLSADGIPGHCEPCWDVQEVLLSDRVLTLGCASYISVRTSLTPEILPVPADAGGDLTPAQAYDDRPARAAGAYVVPDTPDVAAALAAAAPPAAARPSKTRLAAGTAGRSKAADAAAARRRASPAAPEAGDDAHMAAPEASARSGGGGGGGGGGAPARWNTALPEPERLPPAEAQLAEPLEPMLGDFICRWEIMRGRGRSITELGHGLMDLERAVRPPRG